MSVLVERTSTQSVSSNPTEIVWDGTIYDPDGWSDIGGSFPSRLTAPSGKGGKVFIASGSAEYGGAAAAYLQVKKNGTDVVGMANAFNAYVGSISVPVYLDDGDYVELLITNVTGNDIIQTDAPTTFGLVG